MFRYITIDFSNAVEFLRAYVPILYELIYWVFLFNMCELN